MFLNTKSKWSFTSIIKTLFPPEEYDTELAAGTEGRSGIVAGWGLTKEDGTPSNILMQVSEGDLFFGFYLFRLVCISPSNMQKMTTDDPLPPPPHQVMRVEETNKLTFLINLQQ